MKFLISNLGWNKNELPSIIKLLKLKKIKNLEFSINNLKKHNSKYKTIRDVKNFWNSKSIKLYSMQSILYKINDAFIFGTLSQQKIFYKEVVKKIKLANSLDAKILVLGSPKNKKVFDKSKKECDDLMFKFLRKISLLCKKYKVILCLEANPKIYKTEYLTKTCEAINFVKKIKSKYIKLNLDLGTVIANKEKLNLIIKKNLKLIGHVQISSPYLKNLIDYKLKIKKLIYYLNIYNYKKKISIEMLAEKKNNVEKIKKIFKIIEQVK